MNKCVTCGDYAPEGTQLCWRCEREKEDDCSTCENKNSIECLHCKWWRSADYYGDEEE